MAGMLAFGRGKALAGRKKPSVHSTSPVRMDTAKESRKAKAVRTFERLQLQVKASALVADSSDEEDDTVMGAGAEAIAAAPVTDAGAPAVGFTGPVQDLTADL